MTGFTCFLVTKVTIIEYAYVLSKFNGFPNGFTGHFDFGLNFLAHKPEYFFFWFVTMFTCLALVVFTIHVVSKYMRNLTMNEEYKYEKPFELWNLKMGKMEKYLTAKTEISYDDFEKVKKDFALFCAIKFCVCLLLVNLSSDLEWV